MPYCASPGTRNTLEQWGEENLPLCDGTKWRTVHHATAEEEHEMAPGTRMELLAEGYANDTYMLALCIGSLTLMLMATSDWVHLMEHEINVGKSMVFEVQHRTRAAPETHRRAQRVAATGASRIPAVGNWGTHEAQRGDGPPPGEARG